MTSFIVVDNRQVPLRDFQTEASYASFHRNASSLVGKYCTLSDMYLWFPCPDSVAIALSPDKARLLHKSQWNVSQLAGLLEPKYTCMGGPTIPKTTWSTFLVDALQKCVNGVTKYVDNKHPTFVLLLSTDLALLGDQNTPGLEEALDRFCNVCSTLHNTRPGLKIRIMCTIVSDISGYKHYENANMVKVLQKLKRVEHFVSFHSVVNSPLHFEEELRVIVARFPRPLLSKIEFPMQFGAQCSVVLRLQAGTCSAANALHAGLKAPELCGLVARAGVDPCHIDGKGFKVTCPAPDQAVDLLPSAQSQYQNTLTFRSLARYLAAKDALLILRASYIMPDSSGEQALLSDQYWALVPPPCQTAGNPGIPGESAPPPADSHMVLLKLLDRDDVLVADSVDASSHLTGHGGTETDAAADMEMQEEIERYLEDSLCSSLGCPTTYNAMVYTSNTINNMYERQCKLPAARSSAPVVPVSPQVSVRITAPTLPAPPPLPPFAGATTTHTRQVPEATNARQATISAAPKGSLALATKSNPTATPAPLPSITTAQAAGAAPATGRQPAAKKRLINPSFFPSGSDDADTDTALSTRTGVANEPPAKRGPGRPPGSVKKTAADGTKNYNLPATSTAPPSDQSAPSAVRGSAVNVNSIGPSVIHHRRTAPAATESPLDLDLALLLDTPPTSQPRESNAAYPAAITAAGAAGPSDVTAGAQRALPPRGYPSAASTSGQTPARAAQAVQPAVPAVRVTEPAVQHVEAAPAPPRFLKRKFGGGPFAARSSV